jgi:hypothetical protein
VAPGLGPREHVDSARQTDTQHATAALRQPAIGLQWVQPLRHGDPIARGARWRGWRWAGRQRQSQACGRCRRSPRRLLTGRAGPGRRRRARAWSGASRPPIDAPCTQCLRHGDPIHAHERRTSFSAAAPGTEYHTLPSPQCTARQEEHRLSDIPSSQAQARPGRLRGRSGAYCS